MSASVNKVILLGNLGKDPKVSTLNSGDKVVSFTLATSESWKDKNTGERREKTEWHNIVVYNDSLGGVVEKYCKKGTKLYLEGQIQTRKYTDQGGAEKFITEIVLQKFRGEITLLGDGKGGEGGGDRGGGDDRGSSRGGSNSGGRSSGGGGGGAPRGAQTRPNQDFDDDIPFAPDRW